MSLQRHNLLCRALLLLMFLPFSAQSNPGDIVGSMVGEIQAGQYCQGEIVNAVESPGLEGGKVYLFDKDPNFLSDTRTITIAQGTGPGVRLRLRQSGAELPVTITLTHPPFRNTARTAKQFHETYYSGGESRLFVFTFDNDYEMVPGTWIFEANSGNQLIYKITFEIMEGDESFSNPCVDAYS